MSGGAPTETSATYPSASAHTSAAFASTPTARSRYRRTPWRAASCATAASCSAASHCRYIANAISSFSPAAKSAASAEAGLRKVAGQSPSSRPKRAASDSNTAKRASGGPCAVHHASNAAYKDAVLRACFSALDDDPVRHAAFEAWCTAQGPPLARFAVFESLAARFGRELGDWPATFRNPASADVALFAAGENDEIAFAMYLQ